MNKSFNQVFLSFVALSLAVVFGVTSTKKRIDALDAKVLVLEQNAVARDTKIDSLQKQVEELSDISDIIVLECFGLTYRLYLTQEAIMYINPKVEPVLAHRIGRVVAYTSDGYGIDPLLIVALMRIESNFNPKAKSHVGAMGLLQVMPSWCKKFGIKQKDLWDIETNIETGIGILDINLHSCGEDIECALNKYNGCYPSKKFSNKVLAVYKELLEWKTKK